MRPFPLVSFFIGFDVFIVRDVFVVFVSQLFLQHPDMNPTAAKRPAKARSLLFVID